MPLITPQSARERYIIRSTDPQQLAQFIGSLSEDSGIDILDKIGPAGQAHTAIVAMSNDKAALLEQRIRTLNQLTIEPDRPLSLFSAVSGSGQHGRNEMPKITESASSNPSENHSPKADGPSSQPSSGTTNGDARVSAPPAGASASSRIKARGTISERKGQYLIAVRRPGGLQPMGLQPLNFAFIEQTLRTTAEIDILDTVGPKNIMGVLADGVSDVASVLVAQMTEQKAGILHQQAQGRLIVERDHHLSLMDPAFQPPPLVAGVTPTTGQVLATVITVVGKDNTPIKDAEVYLFGSFIPGSGVTDEQGRVTVTMFGETVQSIRSLYVKPKTDYWSFYQTHPGISNDEENVVILRPLAEWPSLPNFPQQQMFGWGQRAMRLDQVPGHYRGQGIKIAVIDSGAATSHVDLHGIRFGFDIINKKINPNTWSDDVISHGSHCAGIIAGADNAIGIRGFAPDAEVHVCKLFPGGQTSNLIDALEYCIEQQIDVANLSLGGIEPSEALEQQILRAKRAGVACIVAAGNTGGAVQYPASSPNVLAVSAIGKLNEFPSDSYHTQTVTPQVDADGFFAAKFTCYGPEIGVCAPGVAITSSVPANNYAVWDGTSMAAPHVTGMAALVLAHHPDFQSLFKMRGTERVERLFQIIKLSARRLNLGDPRLTGFGLPDVAAALSLQAQSSMPKARRATDAAAALTAAASRLAPQALMPNAMIGGFSGSQNAAPWSFSTAPAMASAYLGQSPFVPQSWFAYPWGQQGGVMSGRVGGVDAGPAAYMPPLFAYPPFGCAVPGIGLAMLPPMPGSQGW